MGALERKKAARARHSNRISKPRSPADCADRNMIENAATPEQIARGDLHVTDFKMIETVIGGKIKTHTSRVIRNFASTALERWQRAGEIDERQMAAIVYYQRNWNIRHGEQRTTANWGAMISGGSGGGNEDELNREINAKENLRFLDDKVLLRWDAGEVSTFRDVVLFDVAAGIAGMMAGHRTKPRAEAAALQIVKSISHQIALCVIDGRGGQAVKDAA